MPQFQKAFGEDSDDSGVYAAMGTQSYKSANSLMQEYQKFITRNPTMSPHDQIMAQMASAAYIHDATQLKNYIEEVSDISKAGYKLNVKRTAESKGLMLVFERFDESGKLRPTVAFRGTENDKWIGQDGLSNLANATGASRFAPKKVKDTFLSDQKFLNDQMETLFEDYGVVPEDFTGHSLGGARAKLARLFFRNGDFNMDRSQHKVTGFMPAPGGAANVHANDGALKVFATEAFDPVAWGDRLLMTLTGRENVVTPFQSTKGFGIRGAHNIENATPGISAADAKPENLDINNVNETRPLLRENLNLKKTVFTEGFTHTVRGMAPTALGIGTGFAAHDIMQNLDPTQALGPQGDLVAEAAFNTAIDSAVAGAGTTALNLVRGQGLRASAFRGASKFARSAPEMALPMLAGYEVANYVGNVMGSATQNWEDRGAAGAVSGGVTGAAAAAAGVAALGVQNAAFNTAVTAYRAANVGRYALLAAEGAEAASGLAAGEEVAGEVALLPIPGARVVAGAIAVGTLIGAGLGWLFSHHDTEEETRQKELNNEAEIRQHFENLTSRYIVMQQHFQAIRPDASVESQVANPSQILTESEIEFINALSPTFFDVTAQNTRNVIEHQIGNFNLLRRVNEIRTNVGGLAQISDLSDADRDLLLASKDPQINAYMAQWNTQLNGNTLNLRKTSAELNVPEEELRLHYQRLAAGEISQAEFDIYIEGIRADQMNLDVADYQLMSQIQDPTEREAFYNRTLTRYAHSQGFFNADDYLQSKVDTYEEEEVAERESEFAKNYTKQRSIAQHHGFYSADELMYASRMETWTPAVSDILHARNLGMTANSADKYLESFAQGRSADRRAGSYDRAVQDQDQSEDLMDLLHLRKDLAYAGYSGAHDFKFDDNGNWTFTGTSSRNQRQLRSLDFLRSQVGSEALDEALTSRLENFSGASSFNLRSLIQDLHREVKDRQNNSGLEKTMSVNDFWEMYELN